MSRYEWNLLASMNLDFTDFRSFCCWVILTLVSFLRPSASSVYSLMIVDADAVARAANPVFGEIDLFSRFDLSTLKLLLTRNSCLDRSN